MGCVHEFNTFFCDDGDVCMVVDFCDGGECVGVGVGFGF